MELKKAADILDIYTAVDTTKLRSYELYSPPHTPLIAEENAQEVDSITAWQQTPSTQPALPEELALRFSPTGTAIEPPDTDTLPPTLIYPPSPKRSRMTDTEARIAGERSCKRPLVGERPGEAEVEMIAADELFLNEGDKEGSESEDMEFTKEEERAAKIWDKRIAKMNDSRDKKVHNLFVGELKPMITQLDGKIDTVAKAVQVVDGKVDGALARIDKLENAPKSPPGSSTGSLECALLALKPHAQRLQLHNCLSRRQSRLAVLKQIVWILEQWSTCASLRRQNRTNATRQNSISERAKRHRNSFAANFPRPSWQPTRTRRSVCKGIRQNRRFSRNSTRLRMP